MNARNIQQKVASFVDTLESHSNFRDMRNSIERLINLCNEDELYVPAEDSISVVNISKQ